MRIALVMAEPEYDTRATLPAFAAQVLHAGMGFEIDEVAEDPVLGDRLAGFVGAMRLADLVILSVRRRALHPREMKAFKDYLARGKPLVAIRTSSHAFDPRGKYPAGYETWPGFDARVLGGNYHGHHAVGPLTAMTAAKEGLAHPILKDVAVPFTGHGSLYKVSPLGPRTTPLLVGRIEGADPEPVAWTHRYGQSKVFYTSLGHPGDFREEPFVRLLANAAAWAVA